MPSNDHEDPITLIMHFTALPTPGVTPAQLQATGETMHAAFLAAIRTAHKEGYGPSSGNQPQQQQQASIEPLLEVAGEYVALHLHPGNLGTQQYAWAARFQRAVAALKGS